MRRPVIAWAGALALVLASAVWTGPGTATATPAPGAASTVDTTATEVTDVTLRWGMSDEANNRSFAPGRHNFFSAGRVADPGRGGWTMTERDWRASAGTVRIEKRLADGSHRLATWDGLTTTADDTPIPSPTSGRFSDHTVVVSGGTGWVDPDSGRAHLDWDGQWTVVSYSGLGLLHVADVELNVGSDGTGRLTGTVTGYAASQQDLSAWDALPPRRVVLADLDDVAVGDEPVIDAVPAYTGVTYAASGDAPAQVRTGRRWGSWPQSYVDYLQASGQAAYWYSTGGATDPFKAPLPLSIGYVSGGETDVPPGDPVDTEVPGTPTRPGDGGDGGEDTDDPDDTGNDPDDGPDNGPDNGPGDDTDDAGPRDRGRFQVRNAQLRWGFNRESNNSGHAPGTYNFFSAGTIPNPGQGGTTLARADWRARAGTVRIEKQQPDGRYRLATWGGLGTTPDGEPLGSPTTAAFSGHQVVVGNGTGTVAPRQGRATIAWKGTWTVLYYSGMTYFHVSNPQLTVRRNQGVLRATLHGYGTSRDDTTEWDRLPRTRVVLARLGTVRLGGAKGFSVTPRYRGVRYDAPAGGTPQVRTGDSWGSFPAPFVDFQERTGQLSFWYSSGSATDPFKAPLPLTVSYRAKDPPRTPDDRTDDPREDRPDDRADDGADDGANDGADGGADDGADDGDTGSGTGADSPGSSSDEALAPSAPLAAAASPTLTLVAATTSPTTAGAVPAAPTTARPAPWPWLVGGFALALAALLPLLTRLVTRPPG
jgi:hypothetical protein